MSGMEMMLANILKSVVGEDVLKDFAGKVKGIVEAAEDLRKTQAKMLLELENMNDRLGRLERKANVEDTTLERTNGHAIAKE